MTFQFHQTIAKQYLGLQFLTNLCHLSSSSQQYHLIDGEMASLAYRLMCMSVCTTWAFELDNITHFFFVFVAQFWPTHCIEDFESQFANKLWKVFYTWIICCFFDCIIFWKKRFLTQKEKGMTIKRHKKKPLEVPHDNCYPPSFIFVVAKLVKQHGHLLLKRLQTKRWADKLQNFI